MRAFVGWVIFGTALTLIVSVVIWAVFGYELRWKLEKIVALAVVGLFLAAVAVAVIGFACWLIDGG